MKIVINKSIGGLELSCQAMMEYAKIKGIKLYVYEWGNYDFKTDEAANDTIKEIDPLLVKQEIFVGYTTKPVKNIRELEENYFYENSIERNDLALIEVVEKLGEKANGPNAELKIIEIPDDVKWEIKEGEAGGEWIAEQHRTWY
jgi:hypothetical protein